MLISSGHDFNQVMQEYSTDQVEIFSHLAMIRRGEELRTQAIIFTESLSYVAGLALGKKENAKKIRDGFNSFLKSFDYEKNAKEAKEESEKTMFEKVDAMMKGLK